MKRGLETTTATVGLPVLAFAMLWLMLVPLGGDHALASFFFRQEGGHWALEHAFVTERIVHVGGKYASIVAWAGVMVAACAAVARPSLRLYARPLLALGVSVLAATTAVSVLKSVTGMDCPWDLIEFGGDRPFIGLFDARPHGLGHAECFPAGHSSAGYAWVALYFYFAAVKPHLRWAGLATGLGLGLLFGISQQLRGAHFASHDLASVLVCWLVAVAIQRILPPRLTAPATVHETAAASASTATTADAYAPAKRA